MAEIRKPLVKTKIEPAKKLSSKLKSNKHLLAVKSKNVAKELTLIAGDNASELRKQRKELRNWIESNINDADMQKLVELHASVSKDAQQRVLELIISSFATINGIQNANITLNQVLDMPDARIDMSEASGLANLLFKINIFQYLLASSGLSEGTNRRILNRYISRVLPLKDSTRK